MKTKVIFLLIIIAATITQSCKKDVQNDNKRLKSIDAVYDPPFYSTCFSVFSLGNEYVINDSIAFKNLEDSMRMFMAGCDTAKFTHIDFNAYTLIGKKVDMGVCDSISREMVADTVQKKYIYTIEHKHFVGICVSILKISMNWVLVPKIPVGYTVEFDYIED